MPRTSKTSAGHPILGNLVPAELVERFREQIRAAYLTQARHAVEQWSTACIEAEAAARTDINRFGSRMIQRMEREAYKLLKRHGSTPWHRITQGIVESGMPNRIAETKIIAGAAKACEVIEGNVIADADAAVDEAIQFFNIRVGEKVRDLLQIGESVPSTAALSLDGGVIVGTVDVQGHRWHVSLITNYRYGANSANGVLTAYWQVPCRYKGQVAAKA